MELAAFILAVVAGAWGIIEKAWIIVLLAVAVMLITWTTVFGS